MFKFLLFFIFFSCLSFKKIYAKNKDLNINVIYQNDNRKEFYEIKDKKIKDLSLSVVALFTESSLQATSKEENFFDVIGDTLEVEKNICSTEKYSQQIVSAFCSGFLIAPNLIMSAGHCVINQEDCENTKFVFDYYLSNKKQKVVTIPKNSIYSCKDLVSSNYYTKLDYSIIRLDRKVTDRKVLKLRTKGLVKKDTKIFTIGYPNGLALKLTQGGASVLEIQDNYFSSNLDTFAGNSGSPVINSKTYKVEGLLAFGEVDYVYNKNQTCYSAKICKKNTDCDKEGATKITKLKAEISYAKSYKHSRRQPDSNNDDDFYRDESL